MGITLQKTPYGRTNALPRPGQDDALTAAPPQDNSGAPVMHMQQSPPRIGKAEVAAALAALVKYKAGKSNLESRIVEDEQWYKLRHWAAIRSKAQPQDPAEIRPEPASAWLFNALANKHADACDNYPEPTVLPREETDDADAKTLSAILPVIIERNGFAQVYADNWWEKLKHGTAAYGIFWNSELESGIGDIDIRAIDLLNIFWEPGITNLQKSRYLFVVDLWDNDSIVQAYPHAKGNIGGSPIDVRKYVYDDDIDVSNKSLVIDCYYKSRAANGKTILHLAKICGDCLLFASENNPQYAETGIYAHGRYPIILDSLYPEKGTPVGFGYVAVCKDPQMYIDKLGQNILENAMMATKIRYFATNNTGINEAEFLDWSKPIIHIEGSTLDEAKLRQVAVQPLNGVYVNILQMKIDELKETASNRDVNSGAVGSGVTAAAAIAALQEAGNKSSRDMISASYRAYTDIIYICIELIRQFYDERRTFRITGKQPQAGTEYISYSNASIKDQPVAPAYPNQQLEPGYVPSFRRPIFDVKIQAEKRNPFSQMAANENAKELYRLGVFAPEKATESLIMLDMMEFEGIDQVRDKVQQGQTLLSVCRQMGQQLDRMAAIIQSLTGKDMGISGTPTLPAQMPTPEAPSGGNGARTLAKSVADSRKQTMTAYGAKLAKRATPDMRAVNRAATPGSGG